MSVGVVRDNRKLGGRLLPVGGLWLPGSVHVHPERTHSLLPTEPTTLVGCIQPFTSAAIIPLAVAMAMICAAGSGIRLDLVLAQTPSKLFLAEKEESCIIYKVLYMKE